jgi:bla regulator protein blaR1
MNITEHLYHPAVNALGWALLHSLWQFALIAALLMLLLRFLRHSSPVTRHNLVLIALLAMPLTFGYTLFSQWVVFSRAQQLVSLGFEDVVWLTHQGSTSFFAVPQNYPAFLEKFDAFTPMIFLIYFAGTILFSLSGLAGYIRLFVYKNRYSYPLPEKWADRVSDLIYKSGLTGNVKLFISSRISVPCVAGFVKPVILLPLSFFSGLTPAQIEAILLHEFKHIKRLDHYVNMLQNILETLLFFHPAVWWISNQLRNERENCVDEWVVKTTGKPRVYAEALLSLETEKLSAILQPAMAAVSGKNQLFTRIKNIMNMKTRKINSGQKIAALLLVISAVVSLAWINPAFITVTPTNSDLITENNISLASNANPFTESVPDTVIRKEPENICLQDGTTVLWKDLSEKDRMEIQRAIEEARLAVSEAKLEVMEHFKSEEFQEEMRKMRVEVAEAMEIARQEVEKIQSEEFRKEIETAREEIRKAMEQMDKEEMQQAREEMRKAMQEMENIDWTEMNSEITKALIEASVSMEEAGKLLQDLGPILNESLQQIEIEKIMEELSKSLKELNIEMDEAIEEHDEDLK